MLAVLVCLVCASTTVLAAQEWWRTAVFYQIYPRSFKDSDNDGVGDINGITSKIDYLADLGVDAVWLSPIYKSPMADFGYDISNFTDVDPIFGNMADLKALISALKGRGIKMIMDFVPNHSSDEHPWFAKSVSKEGKYSDYYVWRDSIGTNDDGSPKPPNNWQSVFSGPAWKWHEARQQFYLHNFHEKQPDLNFTNPHVVQDMRDAMEFWLDLGVDGFRVDAVKYLAEDDRFMDEPLVDVHLPLVYDNMDHIYTTNQNLTFSVIRGWSDLIKEKNKDGKERIMLLEVYNTIPHTIAYYGTKDAPFQMPFNFHLLEQINQGITAEDLRANINDWINTVPLFESANWVVGNHDNSRVATRAGSEMIDAMNMILAMLPGIMVTYYGEELGMTDTYLRFEETVDPSGAVLGPSHYRLKSRDPERTPMQWDDSLNAGFSNHSTWLPVNPNYWSLNVEAQKRADKSHLKVYKDLSKLRRTATFLSEKTKYDISAPNKQTFVIKRSSLEGETYYLIVNLANTEVTVALPNTGFAAVFVYTCSINSGYTQGDKVALPGGVKLRPKAAVILESKTTGQQSSAPTLATSLFLLSVTLTGSLLR